MSSLGIFANGAKAISGAIQGSKGRKDQKNLWNNMPLLGVTAGEKANDSIYGQMASTTEFPGQRQAIDRLNETTATGIYDAQRTANSSLGATQAAVDLNTKKMQAVQDLAGMFSEYKTKRMDALAGWNEKKTDLENQRWDINTYRPWGMKMNEAVDSKKKGFQSMWEGIDGTVAGIDDMVGTAKYMEILKMIGV